MKSYGTLRLQPENKTYWLDTAPQVRQTVKRLFLGHSMVGKSLLMKRTPETTENLLWVLERWPHDVAPHLLSAMRQRAAANANDREQAELILSGDIPAETPARWSEEFPPRPYQQQAAAMARVKRGILIGDDVGLGKTPTGALIMLDNLPALVVCQTHLKQQWVDELQKFIPGIKTHIIKKKEDYPLPAHDVTIISYTMLTDWQDRRDWKCVIYDEIQELRHGTSDKWKAAYNLASLTDVRVGLSATPVYNYAGEIYAVMEVLSPGSLGTEGEFKAEWKASAENKWRVEDPAALGSWLKDQCIFMRRTRHDVGKELPDVLKINHMVDHDEKIIARLRLQANELAEKVLSAGFMERGKAARQLDAMLRQVTGVAKAPFVADFVAELVENGQKVLLGGWHRTVYEIWEREFKARGISYRLYTGSESPSAKRQSKAAFMEPPGTQYCHADVLIMSLRSGAGLNGLQTVCSTAVIGELDWSPQVIYQFVGRLNRDGQPEPVTAFTLMSDCGADPIMAGVLGEKYEQGLGITDPDDMDQTPTEVPENRVSALARSWLKKPAQT